jgi:hypothetical protein
MDNIKIDFGGIRWGGMDWIGLAQDWDRWRAFVNTVTYYAQLKNLSSIQMAEAFEPGKSSSCSGHSTFRSLFL